MTAFRSHRPLQSRRIPPPECAALPAFCVSTESDRAGPSESQCGSPYTYTYIDRITTDDVLGALESQLDATLSLAATISEERSLHRYAPEKWSLRQLLNHVSDTERVFLYRALWFARGFDTPLPSFDQ